MAITAKIVKNLLFKQLKQEEKERHCRSIQKPRQSLFCFNGAIPRQCLLGTHEQIFFITIFAQSPPRINSDTISQCPEINFDKISNTIHKKYIELTSMLQGFRKCIARNPCKQGIEGPCWVARPILANSPKLGRIGSGSQHGPSTPYFLGFHAVHFWNP